MKNEDNKISPSFTKESQRNYQPRYAATLKPDNGGQVTVNAELVAKPEYHILFGKMTAKQELYAHLEATRIWITCWACILLHCFGFIPQWLMCTFLAGCCVNQTGALHTSSHLSTAMPWYARYTGGTIMFFAGFMPLASANKDIAHGHFKEHHQHTKGVLDPDEKDRDTEWSNLPYWKMILGFLAHPSHSAAWDIIFHQYVNGPSENWSERIITNVSHYLQLYILYNIAGTHTFLTILTTGHVAMSLTWLVFHGLLHRPDFYEYLLQADPSGMRRLHPVVEFIGQTLFASVWLEVKWHDIHHSHSFAIKTFGCILDRGLSIDEIETACANLVDEGLFVDAHGKPVTPLAEIGHRIGARKEYLLKKSTAKAA